MDACVQPEERKYAIDDNCGRRSRDLICESRIGGGNIEGSRVLLVLECCWCSSAAGVGYLALRSMVGCLIRVKAEEVIMGG